MSFKIKASALILSLGLLAACATPNTSDTKTPEDKGSQTNNGPSTGTSAGTDVSVNTGAAIEAKSLSRTQFVKALECAQTKTTDKSLTGAFAGQATLFADPQFEASFNTTMKLGGGAQYLIYQEAVKLGCTGA